MFMVVLPKFVINLTLKLLLQWGFKTKMDLRTMLLSDIVIL